MFWMPSHTSEMSMGVNLKRNAYGQQTLVTHLDWRANRLADILAKTALKPFRLDKVSRRNLDDQKKILTDALILMGQVTHAANHTVVEWLMEDGSKRQVLRDTTGMRPRRTGTGKVRKAKPVTGRGYTEKEFSQLVIRKTRLVPVKRRIRKRPPTLTVLKKRVYRSRDRRALASSTGRFCTTVVPQSDRTGLLPMAAARARIRWRRLTGSLLEATPWWY